jgi:small subunit ribosomal protein S3Ae
MSRKEWYDVVAPSIFKRRQFTKTICNKTSGTKIAADFLKGRVYEANLADLNDAGEKAEGQAGGDAPFRKVKFEVQQVAGRNLLTQFHSMDLTADRVRSLVHKWCTLIEAVIEAKTADGYTLRLFVFAFTRRQKNQLSKNTYAKTRLEKWVRFRMTKMVRKLFAKLNINEVVKQLTHDTLVKSLYARCNPILPLRDVKIRKVKIVRSPKFDAQRLAESHGDVPASVEGVAREVAEEVAVAPTAAVEA